jgi:hypothetical protein
MGNIHAVLDTLGDFIKEGKISILDFLTKRHGVSCVFLKKVSTIICQNSSNPYSLLNRLLKGSRNLC